VIGSAIRSARLDRRLTLSDVAAAVGTSKQNVSRIERGMPTTTTLLDQVLAAVGLELVARKAKGGKR
jgi:transcriptional regulator with XRE-family HTH domain